MSLLSLKALGLNDAQGFLKKTHKNAKKAIRYANTKVGFKYRKELASSVARGKMQTQALTLVMKRYKQARNIRGRKPLSTFGRFMRHSISGRKGEALEIGMLDAGPFAAPPLEIKKFRELVSGYSVPVTFQVRKFFLTYGRPKTKRQRTVMLRKGKRVLQVPQRPVVDMFIKARGRELGKDWERAYWLKVMGRSIRL